jgi:hypothetical protein
MPFFDSRYNRSEALSFQAMTTISSPNIFADELESGETVEWTGCPRPDIVFHDEDWSAIPFSLIYGGFTIYAFLTVSGVWDRSPGQSLHWFAMAWTMPLLLLGQYFIWGRFIHSRWKKQRTWYALTNHRALIIRDGARGRTASSAYLDNLQTIAITVRSDGIGRISFGGAVTGEVRRGKRLPPRLPTFDDIESAEAVWRIAARLRDQAHNSAARQ